MEALDALRGLIPESAKDIRLNLQSVLRGSALSESQRWGVALASAIAARNPALRSAIFADAARVVPPAVLEDATAAAALMAMSTVYHRFRHLVGNPVYSEKVAGLRMNRLAHPATTRADFELLCLAVSAIYGCETCIRAHERAVTAAELTPDQVHDAVRIAATVQAAAVALEAGIMEGLEVAVSSAG